jgi:glycerol-3-phosphate dehydrogenase
MAARLVINASGGHHSSLKFNDQPCFQNISWVRAFNIIIGKPLVSSHAIGIPAPSGRLFFLVPRVTTKLNGETLLQENYTAIGTGYVSLERPEASELLSEEDIEPFMLELESALPGGTLTHSDEFTVEWGILPREPASKTPLPINKARINWISDYYLEVLAAKYTTFLSLGVAIAKQALKRLSKKM